MRLLLMLAFALPVAVVPATAQHQITPQDPFGIGGPYTVTVTELDDINTSRAEFAPAIGPDSSTLYFCSVGKGFDLFFSPLDAAGIPHERNRLPEPMNSGLNEGAITFSADGTTAMLTACNWNSGAGDCDLYEIGMGEQPEIGPPSAILNSAYWDAQATLSRDGNTVIFASNRPHMIGVENDRNLYVARRSPGGEWSRPTALPSPITTRAVEEFPCLVGDSTLYFGSNRGGGIGGYDLYVTRLQPDGTWSNPVNLGEPLNTRRDERSIVAHPTPRHFYLASTRNGADLDLFLVTVEPLRARE